MFLILKVIFFSKLKSTILHGLILMARPQ